MQQQLSPFLPLSPAARLHPQFEISLWHLFKLPQDLNARAVDKYADMEDDMVMDTDTVGHERDKETTRLVLAWLPRANKGCFSCANKSEITQQQQCSISRSTDCTDTL